MAQPLPPSSTQHDTIQELKCIERGTWDDNKERVILGPYDYITSHSGKGFRSQLIRSFNAWLQVPPASIEVIVRVVNMLHESSLLIDDIQDSSELRRGVPAAHAIFGIAQTINSANYIYFAALQELQTLRNPQLATIFTEELMCLHRGQGMDLFWRDTLSCPSEEEYLEMIVNKTGGLFRLGVRLMQAESPLAMGMVNYVPLVNIIGLIFQIRDDYMNLLSKVYTSNKGIYEDLTEGKFSFPVIHSIRQDPNNPQLINILKQKTTNVEVKSYAVEYLKKTGSFKYIRNVLELLLERARSMADDIGGPGARSLHKILDLAGLDEL